MSGPAITARPGLGAALACTVLGLGALGLAGVARAPINRFQWTPMSFGGLVLLVGLAHLIALLALLRGAFRGAPQGARIPALVLLPVAVALLGAIVDQARQARRASSLDLLPLGRLLDPQIDAGANRFLVALGLGSAASLATIVAIPLAWSPERAPWPGRRDRALGGAGAGMLALAGIVGARVLTPVEPWGYDLIVLAAASLGVALLIRASLRGEGVPRASLVATGAGVLLGALAALDQQRGVSLLSGIHPAEPAASLARAARALTARPLVTSLDALVGGALVAIGLTRRPAGSSARGPVGAGLAVAFVLLLALGLDRLSMQALAAPLAFYDRFVGIDLPAASAAIDRPLGDLPALRALFLQPDGSLLLDDSDGLRPAVPLDSTTLGQPPSSSFIARSDARAEHQAAALHLPRVMRYLVAADRRAPFVQLTRALATLKRPGIEAEIGLLVAAVASPEASGRGSAALISTRFRDRTLLRFVLLPSASALVLCPRAPGHEGDQATPALDGCLDPVAVVADDDGLRLAILGSGAGVLALPQGASAAAQDHRGRVLGALVPRLRERELVVAAPGAWSLAQVMTALDEVGALLREGKRGRLFSRLVLTIDREGLEQRLAREGDVGPTLGPSRASPTP